MTGDTIPDLNVSDFSRNRDRFVADLGAAYEEWGFVGISGHDIDTTIIQAAFQKAEAFFALPVETKKQYLGPAGWARGYVPFGIEKAKDSKYSDLKEFFHIGRELKGHDHLEANIWPTEILDFRTSVQALYQKLDGLALEILGALALYLQLPKDYFTKEVVLGEALLRILHYPPIIDQNAPNVRAAAHEDINFITLHVGSEQEGLEVLSREGDWVPISMVEGTIICNVGDMLQRLTNRKLPSTTHRVVNPAGDKAKISRYSMPFFVHPDPAMPLDCLASCVNDDQPKEFEAITAGEYHQQRLSEIGLIK